MPSAKIVLGANFGDEGKGLITHLICQEAMSNGRNKVLNILFNGGCQRGHTIDYPGGWRHVFHHFGSGTEALADTLIDSEFIISPTFYIDELCQIHKEFGFAPLVYVNPDCRVATPFDALLNQIVEESRGEDRHGSCGFGIFETIQRYKKGEYSLKFGEMLALTDKQLFDYLDAIAKDYLPKRIAEYEESGLKITVTNEVLSTILNRGLIEAFIKDLKNMAMYTKTATIDEVYNSYDMLVFEGAQGLALDQDNMRYYPYLTPSSTTSLIPLKVCKRLGIRGIETCYVTRSYFTRHGSGPLPTECDVAEINSIIEDLTNVPNPFQKTLRYGKFNIDEISYNVEKDMELHQDKSDKFSLYITQCNYYDLDEKANQMQRFLSKFDNIYKLYDRCGEIKVKIK